jgi:hypothetical protein
MHKTRLGILGTTVRPKARYAYPASCSPDFAIMLPSFQIQLPVDSSTLSSLSNYRTFHVSSILFNLSWSHSESRGPAIPLRIRIRWSKWDFKARGTLRGRGRLVDGTEISVLQVMLCRFRDHVCGIIEHSSFAEELRWHGYNVQILRGDLQS